MPAEFHSATFAVRCDCRGCEACYKVPRFPRNCSRETLFDDDDDSDGWTLYGEVFAWSSDMADASDFLCPACSAELGDDDD